MVQTSSLQMKSLIEILEIRQVCKLMNGLYHHAISCRMEAVEVIGGCEPRLLGQWRELPA